MLAPILRLLNRWPLLQPLRYPLKRLLYYHLRPSVRRHWEPRIRDVIASPDNALIPRVAQAGRTIEGSIVMHNGLKVLPGSYYDEPVRVMLERNRGVHEPQEERVFAEVLKVLPPGATMLELGSYWAFYSLWFHQEVAEAACYMVEPEEYHLRCGERNFALNDAHGTFLRGGIGAETRQMEDGTPILTVDGIVKDRKLRHLHILHADIQGFEREMLSGAQQTIDRRLIDYIFISTHSPELHAQCRDFLRANRYVLLADVDLDETYSHDGLLTARREELAGLAPVPLAKKGLFLILAVKPGAV